MNDNVYSKGSGVSWPNLSYFAALYLKVLLTATHNPRIFSVPVDIRTHVLLISGHDRRHYSVQFEVSLPKRHKREIILANNLVVVTSCLRTFPPDA